MEPINTMPGEAIFTIIALAVILVVFGIPLYVVHRRNRNQIEESEQEQPNMEVAPANDAAPQLTQEPAITSDMITVNSAPVPVMNPVSSVNVPKRRQRLPRSLKRRLPAAASRSPAIPVRLPKSL